MGFKGREFGRGTATTGREILAHLHAFAPRCANPKLHKANSAETEALFLDLHLSILDGFISCKIYEKHDDFDFEFVNFAYLDVDVPRRASYGVYISQLIRFYRVSSHVTDFNIGDKISVS